MTAMTSAVTPAANNVGVVFLETLRRNWKTMIYWGTGVGLLVLVNVIAVPDVATLQQMSALLETMPPFLLQAFGMTDMEFMATPEGYMALQFFGLALLIFGAWGIVAGLGVTSNDEDGGMMDVVLAAPVSRWRLVLERLIAFALISIGMLVITFLWMWLALAITPALAVDMGKMFNGMVNILPGIYVMIGFTAFVAALFRRRSRAIAAAASFLVGSYFLDAIGRAAPGSIFETISYLSFMRYYAAQDVIMNGLNLGSILLLKTVAILLALGAIFLYERRDIGK
ncbi:hypothetical protein FBR02_05365 [Anaerolineae bacterium CFX9]|nr:hypothetical protein [Anaerolineae bacterium CFX9]